MPHGDLKHTAIHEAGHFVTTYRLFPDLYPGHVSIIRDDEEGSLGHHLSGESPEWMFAKRDGVVQPERVEDWIVMLYAGVAAQLQFEPATGATGGSNDDELAAGYMSKWLGVADQSRAEVEARLRQLAAAVVKKHWTEIEAVAEELLHHPRLDGEEGQMVADIAAGQEGCTREGLERFRAMKAARCDEGKQLDAHSA